MAHARLSDPVPQCPACPCDRHGPRHHPSTSDARCWLRSELPTREQGRWRWGNTRRRSGARGQGGLDWRRIRGRTLPASGLGVLFSGGRLTKGTMSKDRSSLKNDRVGSSSNVKRSSSRPSPKRHVTSSELATTLITMAGLPVRRSTTMSPRCIRFPPGADSTPVCASDAIGRDLPRSRTGRTMRAFRKSPYSADAFGRCVRGVSVPTGIA